MLCVLGFTIYSYLRDGENLIKYHIVHDPRGYHIDSSSTRFPSMLGLIQHYSGTPIGSKIKLTMPLAKPHDKSMSQVVVAHITCCRVILRHMSHVVGPHVTCCRVILRHMSLVVGPHVTCCRVILRHMSHVVGHMLYIRTLSLIPWLPHLKCSRLGCQIAK